MNAPSDDLILNRALDLAARGFHLFPIKAGAKKPPLVGFTRWATTDQGTIRRLARQHPDCNWGIYTGSFGNDRRRYDALLVIDVDNKGNKHGDQSLEALIAACGTLPETYTQYTPTGGRHLFFRVPKAVKQGVDVLGSGLDIRSRGGYIVASGSVIGDKFYDDNGGEVAPAPEWLIELCNQSSRNTVLSVDARNVPEWADDDLCVARAQEFLIDYPPAIEGSGGDADTVQMFMRLGDLGITPRRAVEVAHDWNYGDNGHEGCVPPWESGEFQTKANSAFGSRLRPFGCDDPRYLMSQIKDEPQLRPTTISADEAVAKLRETPWFRDAAMFVAARKYKDELTAQYIKDQESEQRRKAEQEGWTPRHGLDSPPIKKVRVPDNVRNDIEAKVHEHFPHAPKKAPKLQIRATAGLGKTRLVIKEVQRSEMRGKVIWILEPTHQKAIEIAKEIPRAKVVYGRTSKNAEGKAMCARPDLVEAVQRAGLNVQKTACIEFEDHQHDDDVQAGPRACPHFKGCSYQHQHRHLEAVRAFHGKGVFVMAHQYLYVSCDAPPPDLIIIDESVVKMMKADFEMYPDDLFLPNVALEKATWDTLVLVHEALVSPTPLLGTLRQLGVTADTLERAATNLNWVRDHHTAQVNPETDEQVAVGILNRRESTVIAKRARLCRALAAEIDLPRDICHAVELRGRTIVVHYLHELRYRSPPLLLIDASADLDINRRLFGNELQELHLDVERRAFVIQTHKRDFSNQSLLGQRKDGRPHWPEKAKRLRDEVARVTKFLGMTLVLANKGVEAALVPHLNQTSGDEAVATGHFGALRGLNAFENHEAGAIVGREQPGSVDVEGFARAYHATDPEPLQLGIGGYSEEVRGYRMASGPVTPVTVQVHPDPRVQKFLEQIREREVEQALDRMRLVWAKEPKRVLVLSEVVYDLTVAFAPTWETLTKMVERFEAAADAPVLIMSRRGLAESAPNVWTGDTARRDLEVLNGVWGLTVNRDYYLPTPPTPSLPSRSPVEFTRAAGGGAKLAMVLSHITDKRKAVEAIAGPLSALREL